MRYTHGMKFGKKVRTLRRWRDLSQQDLAGKAGLSVATIVRAEEDKEGLPRRTTTEALARALEVSQVWLTDDRQEVQDLPEMGGDAAAISGLGRTPRDKGEIITHLHALIDELRERRPAAGAAVLLPPEWRDRFVAVPLLSDRVAAGAPAAIDEQDVEDYVIIYKPWCPHPQSTSCVRVRGDSMAPLLAEGSIVAIDTSIRRLDALNGKVVALKDPEDGGATIKRLILRGSVAVFQPENRAYPGLEFPAAQVEDQELIIGKVIWSWGLFD